MAVKSKNPKIAIKNPDMRQYVAGQIMIPQMTDSGAGIPAGSLVELSSGNIKTGTEQNVAVMGVTRNAIAAGAKGDVEFGFVPVKCGSPVNVGERLAPRAGGYVGKAQVAQDSLLGASAGGNFGNQPAGDGIEIVSDAVGDTTQSVTIYGTITGTTDSVTSETVALNGTTAVSTVITTWQTIVGVRLSAACAGTITVREASGNATVTTIAAASLTAGIETALQAQAYGLIPRHDASGATTAPIAIIGTGLDGSALSVVDAMNGATEEDHGTTPYATVTEIMIGAVASTVNVNILTNEASDASAYCGVALQTTAAAGLIDANIVPYWTR